MLKILRTIFVFALSLTFIFTALPVLRVYAYSASAYILYSPDDKEILLSQNKDTRMSMASTTKIMTALILCENDYLNKIVTVPKAASVVEGTALGLHTGDKIARENLLYGLMLESGNDAAVAIAIDIGGSCEVFAELMNERAEKIGMKSTNFVTPNGLDNDNHYTTAYDMALLASVAMQNETFRKVVGTKTYRSIYNSDNTIRTYTNHNRLLYSLDGAEGIKTGFTKKSGRCLVSSCKRMNKRLICVTLKAPDDWNDHKAMYDYGFSKYTQITLDGHFTFRPVCVAGGVDTLCELTYETVDITVKKDLSEHISYVIEIPHFLYAPIKCSDTVGYITYFSSGKVIAKARILSASKVNLRKNKDKNKLEQIFNWMLIMLKAG